jgi:hypothetical protein
VTGNTRKTLFTGAGTQWLEKHFGFRGLRRLTQRRKGDWIRVANAFCPGFRRSVANLYSGITLYFLRAFRAIWSDSFQIKGCAANRGNRFVCENLESACRKTGVGGHYKESVFGAAEMDVRPSLLSLNHLCARTRKNRFVEVVPYVPG